MTSKRAAALPGILHIPACYHNVVHLHVTEEHHEAEELAPVLQRVATPFLPLWKFSADFWKTNWPSSETEYRLNPFWIVSRQKLPVTVVQKGLPLQEDGTSP